MYISIRHYKAKPGAVPEVVRRVEESFLPLISTSPGFTGYYVIDSGNNTLTSISIFGTKAEAEASNSLAAGWIRNENITTFLPEPPMIIAGDVDVLKERGS